MAPPSWLRRSWLPRNRFIGCSHDRRLLSPSLLSFDIRFDIHRLPSLVRLLNQLPAKGDDFSVVLLSFPRRLSPPPSPFPPSIRSLLFFLFHIPFIYHHIDPSPAASFASISPFRLSLPYSTPNRYFRGVLTGLREDHQPTHFEPFSTLLSLSLPSTFLFPFLFPNLFIPSSFSAKDNRLLLGGTGHNLVPAFSSLFCHFFCSHSFIHLFPLFLFFSCCQVESTVPSSHH